MKFLLPVIMLFCTCLKAQEYRVTDYGAVGDAKTLNTLAIQKAIEACSAGGGKVVFPAGTYVSGTIYLKSGVTLHLAKDAILLGSTALTNYPYLNAAIDFYGREWAKQALIFAQNVNDVAIEGEGTIDGQGAAFKITTNVKPDRYRNRPYLLWFVGCKNVRVKDVKLRNSAFWMQHYLGCENVEISGINIWNHSNKNNDMLDIDGCKNVVIDRVNGDSDDDGITLKSTSRLVSENITISNCQLSSHCNALKLGTESTGGFRNVRISNCVIKSSAQRSTIYGLPDGNSGVSLEMVDGGIMENIDISDVRIDGPQVPLFIRLGNRARKYTDSAATPPVGIARNISIKNLAATGADTTGCSITGIPGHYIENITLSNISIEASGGGVKSLAFKKVEELETLYPEGIMFGKLPSFGIYMRHVKEIKLNDVTLRYRTNEERPGIVFEDVKDFSLKSTDIQTNKDQVAAIIAFGQSSGIISGRFPAKPGDTYLLKSSAASIRLSGLRRAKQVKILEEEIINLSPDQ